MQSFAKSRLAASLSLVVALVVYLGAATSSPVATNDPILEIHADALTTYLPSGVTNIQDVRPHEGQRGVNLDGSFRAGPHQRMQIAGNPFEDVWPTPIPNGVRLDLGTYAVQDVDIALPAEGFSWVVGRSYNARQEDSGGSHRDSDGYQGKNWFQTSQPEIVLHEHATDDDKDVLYLVYGADRFVEFKRVDIAQGTSDTFKATNGAAGVVLFEEGATDEPDTYTLTDQHGNELVFFGFDADADPAEGQLWKIEDPDGNVAFVGHETTGSTAITDGFTSAGYISTAYDTSDRRYSYTYSTLNGTERLIKVEAETKTGGTWASPTGVETAGKVEYGYYGDESYGDIGDLELVTITVPLTDSGVNVRKKKYYRYWEGTFNASTNPGHPHGIKYIVDYEGTRRQDWEDTTFDEDFLSLSNTSLEPYASAYFEYDFSHRIVEAWFNGECGCSGGNNGTHEYEHETNGLFVDNTSSYDLTWKFRTVVKRPDDAYETYYFDEAHQLLCRVLTDADPDNTAPAPDRWVTDAARDANGHVTSIRMPSNITGYVHSTGTVTGSTTAGLVYTLVRETSGATKGFLTARQWAEGTPIEPNYDAEWEYESDNLAIGDSHVIRPQLDKRHAYDVVSTCTSDRVTTDLTPSVHSGTLALDSNQLSHPIVETSRQGSGTATTTTPYERKDGTSSFAKAEDGVITYTEYTGGLLTERIEDADTGETSDFDVSVPGGLSSESGAHHRATTYTYDPQGRLETTTQPDGRVLKSYYSKLADGRFVTLSYNDYETSPSIKYFGPVRFSVRSHTGKVEAQGVVGLTGNESTSALTSHIDETDDDPTTAFDLGSIERLTVQVYDDTGYKLEESRSYFSIPSSLPGTDGTHYDPTVYGYDDLGRQRRVKEASGTIRRTARNVLGLVSARWIGTNDSSFAGGESSGTDNMVKTAALEYDGDADDGNGYLTKRTLYVEDSDTDKRVTTYTNDVRGNVLLEDRPTTPHAFHAYDNRGRRTATALYSSTASISPTTDNPVSEATNRLALTRTYYDDKGQVYNSTRHEIDASDGSDDDNLETLHTYDEAGRLLKTDGSQLTKFVYDRYGKQTHRFILAKDNDTTYAHASDVSGDTVLEEHQTVCDPDSGEALLRVVLMRYENDAHTGAIDGNADADDLKLTMANLEGRPQITALWYDRFGRVEDEVRYGTYGGSDFDRDGLSVPARSDTALRTSYSYDTDGSLQETEDPRAIVTRYEYDAVGRRTKVIENYDASVNSGNPSGTDDNRTTTYAYTNDLQTSITADLPSGQTDQTTNYTYGTTKGASAGDSKIETGHLLQEIKYPDYDDQASVPDKVSIAYNAQGQEIWREGQAGNITEIDYDDSGREEHRRITTLATGFDGAVRRITRSHTDLGQPELVTSHDNATVGSGSVVNEVKYTYDGWGNVTKFEQDRNSTVGASGSVDDYEVSYTYEKATSGRNTLRRDGITLPSGNILTLDYTLDEDDEASRVSKVLDGAVTLAQYEYLGTGMVVGTTHPQPEISSLLYGSTEGSYPDLDRLNRVIASRWSTDRPATPEDFYDVDVTYDRNSNVLLTEDNVHVGFDVDFDVDELDRLVDAQEGTWNGSSITSETRQQDWTLTHTGNWDHSTLDLDGDGSYTGADEYDDDRTHNEVNELTARDTDDNGIDDYTLSYDAVGSLTDDGENYEYEYDPFGRMRKVKDRSDDSLVAEYKYNALGFLVSVHEDTDDDGDVDSNDKWFHAAYDEGWRMLTSYREDDSDPKEEFINHVAGNDGTGSASYINAVILRDTDANSGWTNASDGNLERRHYYCQNWRGDLSFLVHKAPRQVETPRYSGYGIPFGLPLGDADSDGDRDSSDIFVFDTWISGGIYDARGDMDLDGDVDAGDKTFAVNQGAVSLGHRSLSAHRNRRGLSGFHDHEPAGRTHARYRWLRSDLGQWNSRDPLGYTDGANLYQVLRSSPTSRHDPWGLASCPSSQNSVEINLTPLTQWYFRNGCPAARNDFMNDLNEVHENAVNGRCDSCLFPIPWAIILPSTHDPQPDPSFIPPELPTEETFIIGGLIWVTAACTTQPTGGDPWFPGLPAGCSYEIILMQRCRVVCNASTVVNYDCLCNL